MRGPGRTGSGSTLGMPPMQYLRTVRLRGVREELLGLDPEDSTTVAEVATRWGFTHLGRFAQYYRARYGEPPSPTRRGPSLNAP